MNGDGNGRLIPVMDDLIDIVGLRPILNDAGINPDQAGNFEDIYSGLAQDPALQSTAREIEKQITAYFSSLCLPEETTIYDLLLLSLRPIDAVFTFNWDPFLFDAYQRNRDVVPLPAIYFLHGNVRIGACRDHPEQWGDKSLSCPDCAIPLDQVPTLLPLTQKDYSCHPYIRKCRESAQIMLRDAFTITIFGYGAPSSDRAAVEILREAWYSESTRTLEHVQIIDTALVATLHQRWVPFTPTQHYRIVRTFTESRIAHWPRRTCESLLYPMAEGRPCEDFPLPTSEDLASVQSAAAQIAAHEPELSQT